MDQEIREFVRKFFCNNFEEQMFKHSMGDQHILLSGMKGLIAALSQGVVCLALEEPSFLELLVKSHERLTIMEQQAPTRDHPARQFAIHIGCLIEISLHACNAYLEKHGN